jgi:predicted nucleotidyltransferase
VSDFTSTLPRLQAASQEHRGLQLLVLHGSRARGDARDDSDWDFAYLASPDFDVALLYADLAIALKTDRIDLANLASAGGLIRYRVARDGVVVFEAAPGNFEKFWFEAVSFWCEAGPVLRAGFQTVLDGLDP